MSPFDVTWNERAGSQISPYQLALVLFFFLFLLVCHTQIEMQMLASQSLIDTHAVFMSSSFFEHLCLLYTEATSTVVSGLVQIALTIPVPEVGIKTQGIWRRAGSFPTAEYKPQQQVY